MGESVLRESATTGPMWPVSWQVEAGIIGSPGPGVAPEAGIIAIQVFSRFDSSRIVRQAPASCPGPQT